ncbi:FAM172 family protein homolog CG10038-like isoform X2 [Halichondria panicea]|uniref:FAM172 family protein homolog CG10038-like isoform X2 n=1 Tax=Halichondria panicea TaxID=6063 RepID=UPI00312B808B
MGFPLLVIVTTCCLLSCCNYSVTGTTHHTQHCQEGGECEANLHIYRMDSDNDESAMEVDQTVTEQEDQEDQEMMSQGEDNNGQAFCSISIPESEPEINPQNVDMTDTTKNAGTFDTTELENVDSSKETAENVDISKETTSPPESSADKESSNTTADVDTSKKTTSPPESSADKESSDTTEIVDTSKKTTSPPEESSVDKESSEPPAAAVSEGQKEDTAEEEVKSKVAEEGNKEEEEEEEDEVASFPNTLKEFGYHFEDGRLRNTETGEGFVYEVKKGKKKYNQRHYTELGEVITGEVYEMLENEAGLKRVNIPQTAKKDCSFFFMSEDALRADKLMILIHGSGVVRAGQWARSLIINDCLDSGTQLPYIARAKKEGYGIVVTNTNENTRIVKGKAKQLKESGTPEEHAYYVWQNFVKKSKAQHIDIVAHSYGGVVTVNLMNQFFTDFKKRVKNIAFTDSVHAFNPAKVPPVKWAWLAEKAVNWVMSDDALDTVLHPWEDNVRRLSAGTPKHVETSWKAFESVFTLFDKKDDDLEDTEQK